MFDKEFILYLPKSLLYEIIQMFENRILNFCKNKFDLFASSYLNKHIHCYTACGE